MSTSTLFCCPSIQPYRSRTLLREQTFKSFMTWAQFPREASPSSGPGSRDLTDSPASHVIQLVRQVNYGSLSSTRYFVPDGDVFVEVTSRYIIEGNLQKKKTFKNFRCGVHNKFFELDVYEKDPVNKLHWRADLARPGSEIDL